MVLLKKPLGKVAPHSQSLADLEQTFSMRRRSCDSIMLLFYRHFRYHKLNEGVGFFFRSIFCRLLSDLLKRNECFCRKTYFTYPSRDNAVAIVTSDVYAETKQFEPLMGTADWCLHG